MLGTWAWLTHTLPVNKVNSSLGLRCPPGDSGLTGAYPTPSDDAVVWLIALWEAPVYD
ncbi:hypothetical protein BD777DRAFT_132373 [Yarrowia lipolytica]|nr:hypothetical protein BD777DRAFT_132373 [Yarrowia lipolytica]